MFKVLGLCMLWLEMEMESWSVMEGNGREFRMSRLEVGGREETLASWIRQIGSKLNFH